LRFLDHEGEVARIGVEVDPELEITEIATRVLREGGPVLFFERVKGSSFPLVINLFGTARRIEMALGRPPAEIGENLARLAEGLNPPSMRRVWAQRSALRDLVNMRTATPRSQALSQEVSEAPDLNKLPILKCWPNDGGRFVTLPLVLTTDPATGRRNLGMYRLHVFDARTTGMHWQIQKGGRFHYYEASARRQSIEVAVALGGDPALILAATLPLPENIDEIAFAGLLRRKPYPMVPAETLSLSVPANAEFILEGVVPYEERAMEGPFGDHYGYYSREAPFPVFHLKRITRRRNAIYPATVVGKPPQEDAYIGNATQEIMTPLIRLIHPEVADLWAYYETGFHALTVVSVKVRYRKEAVKTALSLLGTGQLTLCKVIVMVDAEVDPKDFDAVLAAAGRNFEPERDFVLIPGAPIDTLDFSSFRMHLGSKMIVDATSPVEEDTLPEEKGGSRGAISSGGEEVDLSAVDPRICGHRLLAGTLLAVKVSSGGEIAEKLAKTRLASSAKIVAVVSSDVKLEDRMALMWGIFTRFDPARDVLFAEAELRGSWPIYRGSMIIDATFKEGYPEPLEMTEEVKEKVSKRWGEYFGRPGLS
jgi:4-hydroxy-3-polyprenylbenzoate decarboxylase